MYNKFVADDEEIRERTIMYMDLAGNGIVYGVFACYLCC